MYSWPRLERYGNRPVKSVYPIPFGDDDTILYRTVLVLIFGSSDSGKESWKMSFSSVSLKGWLLGAFNFKFSYRRRISSMVSGSSRFLVDCRFCFSLFWCPCDVAIGVSKCFLTNFVVKPGQVVKWFLSIAFSNVVFTGEKQAPWRNCANVLFVSFLRIITPILWFLFIFL